MLVIASTRSGKNGAGCMTPITVTGLPSSCNCVPTILESPAKRFIQKSCVSTITGGTPGPSSLGFVSRPSTGESPMTSKKLPVTSPTSIWTASPFRRSVTVHGEDSAMPPSDGAPVRKVAQPLGVAMRQRLEQHATDDAEDCRIRANAQSERDDDDRGERGTAPERAQRVPDVGRDVLDPQQPTLIADGLGALRQAPRGEHRLTPCLVPAHAAPDVLGRLHVEMGLELLGKSVVVGAVSGEERGDARERGPKVLHGVSRTGARKAAIRSAVLCPLPGSRAPALRPARHTAW